MSDIGPENQLGDPEILAAMDAEFDSQVTAAAIATENAEKNNGREKNEKDDNDDDDNTDNEDFEFLEVSLADLLQATWIGTRHVERHICQPVNRLTRESGGAMQELFKELLRIFRESGPMAPERASWPVAKVMFDRMLSGAQLRQFKARIMTKRRFHFWMQLCLEYIDSTSMRPPRPFEGTRRGLPTDMVAEELARQAKTSGVGGGRTRELDILLEEPLPSGRD